MSFVVLINPARQGGGRLIQFPRRWFAPGERGWLHPRIRRRQQNSDAAWGLVRRIHRELLGSLRQPVLA